MFSVTPNRTREFVIPSTLADVESAIKRIEANEFKSRLNVTNTKNVFGQRTLYVKHSGMAWVSSNFGNSITLRVSLSEVPSGVKVFVEGTTTVGAINTEVEASYVDADLEVFMQCLQFILFPEEAKKNGITKEGPNLTWLWVIGISILVISVLGVL